MIKIKILSPVQGENGEHLEGVCEVSDSVARQLVQQGSARFYSIAEAEADAKAETEAKAAAEAEAKAKAEAESAAKGKK